MMQNSPLFVTKVSPTNKPAKIMANDKSSSEANQTFKQMLSKQVDQSDAKATDEKQNKAKIDNKQQAKGKESTSSEIDQSQVAQGGVTTVTDANDLANEPALASFTDAQSLAAEVTSKTVKDVTDGAVDLDAKKQVDTTQTVVANVTPSTVQSSSGDNHIAGEKDVQIVSDPLAKKGFTPLASSTQTKLTDEMTIKTPTESLSVASNTFSLSSKADINPAKQMTEVSSDIKNVEVTQKAEIGLDVTSLGKDKLGNQLNIEKSTPIINDTALTSTSSTATEAVSSLALTAQVTGKQPSSVEAAQTNMSNFINIPPSKSGWSEAVGQKVAWMVGAAEQSATLTLNPKDLGPLQIIINVNNEKADATFISDNPEVRKALEDGMFNLKQSMSQAGVELGQANVNTGKEHQAFQQANQGYSQRQANGTKDSQATEHLTQRPVTTRVSNGLVDTFA